MCIRSSVSGHLACFHVLAIVNSAPVNIGMHVSFWTMWQYLDLTNLSLFKIQSIINNLIYCLLITWLTIEARIYSVFKLKVELTLYTIQIAKFFSWILDGHYQLWSNPLFFFFFFFK